jgi:hypothetical protein
MLDAGSLARGGTAPCHKLSPHLVPGDAASLLATPVEMG